MAQYALSCLTSEERGGREGGEGSERGRESGGRKRKGGKRGWESGGREGKGNGEMGGAGTRIGRGRLQDMKGESKSEHVGIEEKGEEEE